MLEVRRRKKFIGFDSFDCPVGLAELLALAAKARNELPLKARNALLL
jgi:hypothetical protein